MKKQFGTPEQFKDQVEQRIAELGGEVEAATNTCNVSGEPIRGVEDETLDEYFEALEDKVTEDAEKFMSDLTWALRDDRITISIPGDEKIHVVEVPLADLSKDMEHIDEDAEYIVRFLKDEFGIEAATDVKSAYNWDEFNVKESKWDEWEQVAQKSVLDADGFWTDYTMYKKKDEDLWIFIFGDSDVYMPEEEYADWSTDDEAAAWEWFDSYEGFTDEDLADDSWEG